MIKRKRVSRKVYRILLSALIGVSMQLPSLASMDVYAESTNVTATREYSKGVLTTINNGVGVIDASSDVDEFKDLEDFTFQTTFTKEDNNAINSLFFMGDKESAANYIAVYLSGNRLGLEARNETGAHQVSNATVDLVGVDLSTSHKLTFTVKGGSQYCFYLDGKKVKEGAITANFSKGFMDAADYMGFGNGKRRQGQNSYPFSGTMQNIELYNQAIEETEIMKYHNGALSTMVYSHDNIYYPEMTTERITDNEKIDKIANLNKGTMSVRYRALSENDGIMSLFALANQSEDKYISMYIDPSQNVIGLDAPQINSLHNKKLDLDTAKYAEKGVSIHNTQWHTFTVTKSENRLKFYLDGKYLDQYSYLDAGLFNLLDAPSDIGIGFVPRISKGTMPFQGAVDSVKIYSDVLEEIDIKKDHALTTRPVGQEIDMSDAYRSEEYDLYYSGYDNASAYRIPSMITTMKGTVLAAIDKRNSGAQDCGNIDMALRRKEAGQQSFDDPIYVVDLLENKSSGGSAAFVIDSAMVQDKTTGRIFMVYDMFPESSGIMTPSELTTGTGYEKIDDKDYQILYNADKTAFGTIREEDNIGYVYDNDHHKTDYTVITNSNSPYQERGNLYKNGEYKGNIYMLRNGPDKGELTVLNTSYLWMSYSDDDGKTWSNAVDLTPQVKQDWMLFLGTGPGTGIQLQDGNLVIPVYSSNSNVGGSQSSALIISKDNGETWELKDSPQTFMGNDRETMNNGGQMFTESQAIQLNDGQLKLFMRNTYDNTYSGKVYEATSLDGGETWSDVKKIDINDTYCQLSVVHYTKDNKEYVVMSNPDRYPRTEGKVHLGEVGDDGEITWTHHQSVNEGKFQYSCLTILENDGENVKFALLYETDTDYTFRLKYTEFDEAWIKAGMKTEQLKTPQVSEYSATVTNDEISVSLTFDQTLLAVGNPELVLSLNDHEISASYESGSGSDTLVFKGTLPTNVSGVVKVAQFKTDAGYLENMDNGIPVASDKIIYDLTKITSGLNISEYSSQASNSTAEATDGAAINVIDNNPNTYWHSNYSAQFTLPQHVVIDLGADKSIYKLGYVPRQNSSSGRVIDFMIQGSRDGTNYQPITKGTFNTSSAEQFIEFIPQEVRYIKFIVTSATAKTSCSIAELNVFEYSEGVIEAGNEDKLQEIINEVSALQEADYSSATWSVFKDALDTANDLLSADIVSQNMLDNACSKVIDAKKKLVDVRKAKEVLASINALKESDYTDTSWTAFENAINNLEANINDATSSKSITDMLVKARYAQSLLIKKGDATELKRVVAQYEEEMKTMDANDYKEVSWDRFVKALKDAKIVLANGFATQDQMDSAKMDLINARVNLETDKDALQLLYDQYEDLSSEGYTAQSWSVFETALSKAKSVLENESTPTAVKEAKQGIEDAVNGLKKAIDTEALELLYSELSEVDLTLYMSKGQKAMIEALEGAKAVIENPNSEDQVQLAAKKLSDAYESLSLKATIDQMEIMKTFVEKVKNTDIEHFTQQEQKALNALVSEVELALSTEISKKDAALLIEDILVADELLSRQPSDEPITENSHNPSANIPTGDTSNTAGLAILTFLSLGAIGYVKVKKKVDHA